ncbi:UNVERIFIED_CONTAM: hypothetical protein NCL1_31159 [Trichonephila clavipes]
MFLSVAAETEPGAKGFCLQFVKNTKKLERGMSEKVLVDHIFVRLEPQVQDYVEGRNPENTKPSNGGNDYSGNYENSRQGNQWFESRNRSQNDNRRFNNRGHQFRNRGQNDAFSRGDHRNRGSSENFSRDDRRQMGRLNVLKVSDVLKVIRRSR